MNKYVILKPYLFVCYTKAERSKRFEKGRNQKT
jgi:hypothetical protein